jgi:hypothetical protein
MNEERREFATYLVENDRLYDARLVLTLSPDGYPAPLPVHLNAEMMNMFSDYMSDKLDLAIAPGLDYSLRSLRFEILSPEDEEYLAREFNAVPEMKDGHPEVVSRNNPIEVSRKDFRLLKPRVWINCEVS